MEFIDLTSIYQPPDVTVNRPLKKTIREDVITTLPNFSVPRNNQQILKQVTKFQYLEKTLSGLSKMPTIRSIP